MHKSIFTNLFIKTSLIVLPVLLAGCAETTYPPYNGQVAVGGGSAVVYPSTPAFVVGVPPVQINPVMVAGYGYGYWSGGAFWPYRPGCAFAGEGRYYAPNQTTVNNYSTTINNNSVRNVAVNNTSVRNTAITTSVRNNTNNVNATRNNFVKKNNVAVTNNYLRANTPNLAHPVARTSPYAVVHQQSLSQEKMRSKLSPQLAAYKTPQPKPVLPSHYPPKSPATTKKPPVNNPNSQ